MNVPALELAAFSRNEHGSMRTVSDRVVDDHRPLSRLQMMRLVKMEGRMEKDDWYRRKERCSERRNN